MDFFPQRNTQNDATRLRYHFLKKNWQTVPFQGIREFWCTFLHSFITRCMVYSMQDVRTVPAKEVTVQGCWRPYVWKYIDPVKPYVCVYRTTMCVIGGGGRCDCRLGQLYAPQDPLSQSLDASRNMKGLLIFAAVLSSLAHTSAAETVRRVSANGECLLNFWIINSSRWRWRRRSSTSLKTTRGLSGWTTSASVPTRQSIENLVIAFPGLFLYKKTYTVFSS